MRALRCSQFLGSLHCAGKIRAGNSAAGSPGAVSRAFLSRDSTLLSRTAILRSRVSMRSSSLCSMSSAADARLTAENAMIVVNTVRGHRHAWSTELPRSPAATDSTTLDFVSSVVEGFETGHYRPVCISSPAFRAAQAHAGTVALLARTVRLSTIPAAVSMLIPAVFPLPSLARFAAFDGERMHSTLGPARYRFPTRPLGAHATRVGTGELNLSRPPAPRSTGGSYSVTPALPPPAAGRKPCACISLQICSRCSGVATRPRPVPGV